MKLESGKFSFRAMFKSGSKDLQINEMMMKMEVLRNELNCIDQMIAIMCLNCNYELEQYRLRKGKEYSLIFKKVAESELTIETAYRQLL